MSEMGERNRGASIKEQSIPQSPATNAVEFEAALKRLDGDRDLFIELAEIFKTDCREIVKQMRHAVSVEDATNLEHQAHALKGSAASLGISLVSQTAYEIEKLARLKDLARVTGLLETLEKEVEHSFSELEAFCGG